jgi:hypothetical protein
MRLSAEEKKMWLEDWKRSGKSAWTYAKENGLTPQTFVKWTKATQETEPSFVQVKASVIPLPQSVPEILIEKGDVKIHIPLTVGSSGLRAVMESLGATL